MSSEILLHATDYQIIFRLIGLIGCSKDGKGPIAVNVVSAQQRKNKEKAHSADSQLI
ncbi:hypothetical protein [Flavobacterium olei]|uniref:hypothetical protein n=1 Tax=Flavobacterium olei TaxID=1886782 RepID=UPI003219C7CC